MPHDHDGDAHGHSHPPASFGRAFAIGITLNAAFVAVEVVYGVLAHSMALVADAGHNLSDVLGLFLAWFATVLARRAATTQHTYGLKRSSVLSALFNAMFLLVSVGAIACEAVKRLLVPSAVGAQTVIWVAALGIGINSVTALLFMSGRKGDMNIRGAFSHMAADAVISAGVVVSGVAILFTGWFWLDPAVSLVLVAVIVFGTWELLRDSLNLALDGVPEHIDVESVRKYLRGLPAVTGEHHLHIWGLSTTETALTVHLTLADGGRGDELLHTIHCGLRENFRIDHATVQFESSDNRGCAARECD